MYVVAQDISTFYVATNGSNSNPGTMESPWRSLNYSFDQLTPGDTLYIRGGSYSSESIELRDDDTGQENAPITVNAYQDEDVILKGTAVRFLGANWWDIQDLTFQATVQAITIGEHLGLQSIYQNFDETVASSHINIRNCKFKDGNRAPVRIFYGNDILVDNCYFSNIRSGEAGRDLNAVNIPYIADRIEIKNSRFEDIGSDGVHIGAQSYVNGADLGQMFVQNNTFWVNRPYSGPFGNVGENGIDIKSYGSLRGSILVEGNTVYGFHPTLSGQDTSGAPGEGIVVHNGVSNVVLEKNLFYDNAIHLSITKHKTDYGITRDNVVRNNIFKQTYSSSDQSAVVVNDAVNTIIYHNTFYDTTYFLRSWNSSTGVFKNNAIYNGNSGVSSSSSWESDYNAWSSGESSVSAKLRGSNSLYEIDLGLDPDQKPLSTSPLIDAGADLDVVDDFEGTSRPQASGYDIGAYEYLSADTHCSPLGDVDCSGGVNTLDYAYLVMNWGTSNFQSDLDDSGEVDSQDIVILMDSYRED